VNTRNESNAMREIHNIRLKNYDLEKSLSDKELKEKRLNEKLNVEKIIKEYGLRVKTR